MCAQGYLVYVFLSVSNKTLQYLSKIQYHESCKHFMYPVEMTHIAGQQNRLCLGCWSLELDPRTHAG